MYFYPVLAILCLTLVYVYPKIKKFQQSYILFLGGWIGMIVIGRMNEHYLLLHITFLYPILIHSAVQLRNLFANFYLALSMLMFFGIQGYVFKTNRGADVYSYKKKILEAVTVPKDVILIAPDDLWLFYKQHSFHGYHTKANIEDLVSNKVIFVSNEIHSRFIRDGDSLGSATMVERFDPDFMRQFELITSITDKHYGGFGITKNNRISFYKNY